MASGNSLGINTTGCVQYTSTTGVFAGGACSIANGGTNATSFTQSAGIVVYNGTSLVNYAGPQIDSSGRQTNTSQPGFLAISSTQSNATGDGTYYTNLYATEIYDTGATFSSPTFTAPLTGIYQISTNPTLTALGAAHTLVVGKVVTSNREYYYWDCNGFVCQSAGQNAASFSFNCDMDAADTATSQVFAGTGAKTVGSASGTFFGAYLIS